MHDYDEEQVVLSQEIQKLQKPKLYKVFFHNDDYTTMEFVVYALRKFFGKSLPEALLLMYQVHYHGISLIGIYPYEIASTGVNRTQDLAQKYGHPLMVTMEQE